MKYKIIATAAVMLAIVLITIATYALALTFQATTFHNFIANIASIMVLAAMATILFYLAISLWDET